MDSSKLNVNPYSNVSPKRSSFVTPDLNIDSYEVNIPKIQLRSSTPNERMEYIRKNSLDDLKNANIPTGANPDLSQKKIEQNTEKKPGIIGRFFKRYFGSLNESEKETVRTFKQNIQGLRDVKNPASDLHRHIGTLKAKMREMGRYEKKLSTKPTQETLEEANGFQFELTGLMETVKGTLNRLNTKLDSLKEIEDSMNELKNTYSGFDKPLSEFQSLKKLVIEQQHYINYLNDRVNLSEQFTFLEEFIVAQESADTWESFIHVQAHLSVIVTNLKANIENSPSLKNDKKIQKILASSDSTSPAAIRQLVKLAYPDLAPYSDRLLNHFTHIEKVKIKQLETKEKRITALTAGIINQTNLIDSTKNKLNHWTWFSPIKHLSSKHSLENKLDIAQRRVANLKDKLKLEGAFNVDEVNWLEDKATTDKKLKSIHRKIVVINEQSSEIKDIERNRLIIKDEIQQLIKESQRDLISLFEKRDLLIALKKQSIPNLKNEAALTRQIQFLEESLKRNFTLLVTLVKNSTDLSIDPKGLSSKLTHEGKLKFYLKDIFPEIDKNEIDQLFADLFKLEEARPATAVPVVNIIKNIFNPPQP